ncbi:MAG: MFS transporter [Melioribacteraceae bacterium]|nr:MFS transporter [Melioribacteraceae bacterium]
MNKKAFPIFLVFLCMGFGDVVGPLVGLVKDTFQLSYTMAQLIPFSGFIMFGLLSVPMGIYQDKKGKKQVLILGLAVALIGLLIPILNGMYGSPIEFNQGEYFNFYVVLISIFVLCAGATILQVVGNPIMRDVSPEGKFSKNLSFAQSIKAVGSSLGFLVPPLLAIYFGLEWSILFPIFASLIVITLFMVSPLKISEYKDPDSKPASISSCFSLLKNGYVLMMVAAIFIYVGAEVSMSSGVPILVKENFGVEGFSLWVSWALFFLPILLGRFLGSLILEKILPKSFLIQTVILAIIGVLLMFTGNQVITYIGIIFVGLGLANIFPLIFSIAIDEMPERSNELSGLMVTAIAGGAIIPLVMGQVSDLTNILTGFAVPLLCLLYILAVSVILLKKTSSENEMLKEV